MADLIIANEILRQMGGNRFLVMTGTKVQYGEENSITFKLTKNKLKAKWLKITLNSMDLYDLEFKSLIKDELVTLKEYNNIYSESLQSIFTEATGLYTRL